jgi:hypothetical protein
MIDFYLRIAAAIVLIASFSAFVIFIATFKAKVLGGFFTIYLSSFLGSLIGLFFIVASGMHLESSNLVNVLSGLLPCLASSLAIGFFGSRLFRRFTSK